MSKQSDKQDRPSIDQNTDQELIDIDLRDPLVAGVLAWLWPGAGHMYQGRYGKGALFMVCILGAFFFGLILGDCKVVYASWSWQNTDARRWQYILQLGVGLPAMPAIVQQQQMSRGKEPFFVTGYRDLSDSTLPLYEGEKLPGQDHLYPEAPLAPPLIVDPNEQPPGTQDVYAKWHQELGVNFDMGTLYTVLAGLLNVLAIYDAVAGPLQAVPQEEEEADDEKEKNKAK